MDAAAARGLRFFLTVPWMVQSCFLESRTSRRSIRTAVVSAVQAVASHPALFAIALANEIPPDIIRWSGTSRVARFLDELASAAKDAAPDCLFTYANYPPTEFLRPRRLDFVTFNVFLHSRPALIEYFAHLHIIAEDRPLLLGECGVDSRREGPDRQGEILSWTLEAAFTGGLAGAVVFGFTDDWYRSGTRVEDWEMGLTTVARERKPAFHAVKTRFALDPHPPALPEIPGFALPGLPPPRPDPSRPPMVSVVVACHDGGGTLAECLGSLRSLHYPHYEVILVDDFSSDDTPEIAAQFTEVRTLRLKTHLGLSAARNVGIRAACGEIVAFTDADCRADPDWLRFLVAGLSDRPMAGIGGPNLLPPEDPPMAAVIMAAPGGPVHVLLDDRQAEHVPGCNMAFWKWTLDAVGGFDPLFEQAGDDVDLCWRLQREGWRLGFAPAGFVWHHRRASLGAYLRQQAGYGEAEALLMAKHPAYFNPLGGARWRGRIFGLPGLSLPWSRDVIYRGRFATGMFQTLYTPSSERFLPLLMGVEYHLFLALPLCILAVLFTWLWPFAVAALLVPPSLSFLASCRVVFPSDRVRWWSPLLLALLIYLQPLVRGIARYGARLGLPAPKPQGSASPAASLESEARVYAASQQRERAYWSPQWRDRGEWVQRIGAALDHHGWRRRTDPGWGEYDIEIFGARWTRIAMLTVAETTRDGAQILRCRLAHRWTLAAHVLFWGIAALLLLMIGVFEVNWRGYWVPAVVMGAMVWYFHHRARVLRCKLSVLLDEVAREWGLTSIERDFQIDTPSEHAV
jgi:GT2 family glycosyltransferase